jgi:hypothetical protein
VDGAGGDSAGVDVDDDFSAVKLSGLAGPVASAQVVPFAELEERLEY